MEQTHCPTSENLQLGRLVADALSEIERLGYSRSSQNRYRATWEQLIAFARGIELGDEFSADLAASFLEEYGARDGQVDGPGNGWRRHMVFGVKALADFAKNGRIERAFTEVQAIHLLPAMQNTLRDYEQYSKDRLHLRALDPSSAYDRTHDLFRFSPFKESADTGRNSGGGSVRFRVKSSFLRFLTMRGILQKDLGAELPTIRVPKDATIPSVWDHELIGYSHAETGRPSLGGFDNRNHAGEDGHAVEPASDQ